MFGKMKAGRERLTRRTVNSVGESKGIALGRSITCASLREAVRYAIEVQTEFYRAQRQQPAADRRIEFTSAFIWATSSRRPWLAENASS
jgi:hypothetical protein